MSRRLTKQLRETFVRAAMQDVPKPDDDICNTEFKAILYRHMPSPGQQVYDINPEWLEVRGHNVEPDYNVMQDANSSGLDWNARRDGSFYLRYYWVDYGVSVLPQEAQDYITRLENILSDRVRLRIKLSGIAAACTTVATLKAALPELEKYMPDDTPAPKKNTPVLANLMADVVAAGWPGGKIINGHIVQGVAA